MTLAHGPAVPSELWSSWRPDPLIVAALLLAAVLYRQGLVNLRPRPRPRRTVAFAGGLLAVAVALASPLDGAAGSLFAAHMLQHLVLMMVAAPLLVIGDPVLVMGAALPASGRRRLRRLATRRPARRVVAVGRHPVVVWALSAVVLWAWHLPSLYDAAVRNDALHAVEHATLLGSAALLWAAVLGRRPLPAPAAVGLLFATMLQSSALGAVLTFAGSPLYAVHEATTAAWGQTPLEDQQLAGALMWIPPGIVYLVVMAGLLVRWLESLGTPSERAPVTTGEAR
jgi:putative membrane protein